MLIIIPISLYLIHEYFFIAIGIGAIVGSILIFRKGHPPDEEDRKLLSKAYTKTCIISSCLLVMGAFYSFYYQTKWSDNLSIEREEARLAAVQAKKEADEKKAEEEKRAEEEKVAKETERINSEIDKVSNMTEEELEIFNVSFENYIQSMNEVEARRKAIADTSKEINRRKKEIADAKLEQQRAEIEARKQTELAEANKPENKIKKAVGTSAHTEVTANVDGSYNVVVKKSAGSLYEHADIIKYGSTDESRIRRTNALETCRFIVNEIKETSVPVNHIEIHLTGTVTDIEGYQRTDDIVICEISGNASYKSSDNQSFANAVNRFWTIRGL